MMRKHIFENLHPLAQKEFLDNERAVIKGHKIFDVYRIKESYNVN